ncbi:hypothetical protein BOX15_Mlig021326g1 [Macrostomum lignano]|uniref:Uncharacterized protein n=2 Tax=Macrostomum lignano TaxID=282301 RepID=A0A267F974_9PLAT|nr:hypothetical protein BOX15_Mlig032773g1 [Macrostomum lignano]PAA73898.1 hypothetical protein BOX15_Mlig021326g1 [Macrostomum lignano]
MEVVKDKFLELLQFYDWALARADKRVEHWFLMDSYWPTWALMFAYLLAVHFGQKFMANRTAFSLRWPLLAYNVALVALNFHIFSELLYCSWQQNYSYLCQPVDYSDNPYELRIAKALWWYYFSKCIEFMDTIFFVLRKKNNQISFLHVYHHATMFPIWWIGVKWVPGGQSFFGAMMNSFIHVIMYSYYGLSSLGESVQKYLWWKRYLTRLQLIQFVTGISHAIYGLVTRCSFPSWMMWALVGYGTSILTLFLNFYYHAYRKPAARRPVQESKEKNGTGSVSNGHHAAANGHAEAKKIK